MQEILLTLGPYAVPIIPIVWLLTHYLAEPGESVSILGISYTKRKKPLGIFRVALSIFRVKDNNSASHSELKDKIKVSKTCNIRKNRSDQVSEAKMESKRIKWTSIGWVKRYRKFRKTEEFQLMITRLKKRSIWLFLLGVVTNIVSLIFMESLFVPGLMYASASTIVLLFTFTQDKKY